jgi:hypothetical protein
LCNPVPAGEGRCMAILSNQYCGEPPMRLSLDQSASQLLP